MLLSFRSDRVFEEAARSDEACDKLILRLQRARRLEFVFLLVLLLLVLAAGGWASMQLNHILDSIVSGTPHTNTESALKKLTMKAAAFIVPFLVVMGSSIVHLLHTDACIKMLIFIRGRQSRQSAAAEK